MCVCVCRCTYQLSITKNNCCTHKRTHADKSSLACSFSKFLSKTYTFTHIHTHYVAFGGHPDVAALLCEFGANASTCNGAGRTPVQLVSPCSPSECVCVCNKLWNFGCRAQVCLFVCVLIWLALWASHGDSPLLTGHHCHGWVLLSSALPQCGYTSQLKART